MNSPAAELIAPLEILHVDDDPFFQRLVARMARSIADCTLQFTTVQTEDEAILAFQAQHYDCVLLDCHLEKGDGLSCLKRLRQLNRAVTILALSGTSSVELVARCLIAGADGFILKMELTKDLLASHLQPAISARRRAAEMPA
jgi:CheY-like chemotaxis protein